jgi:hypothetical protein
MLKSIQQGPMSETEQIMSDNHGKNYPLHAGCCMYVGERNVET